MTYEEKLDKLIERLAEERRLTRKGHATKISFSNGSFTKLGVLLIASMTNITKHSVTN